MSNESQTRAELRRAYKERPPQLGIYRVLNTRTGRSLVKASVDLPASINRERAQLRFGGHRNPRLQADWNALGEEAFAFEVLDTLEPRKDQPDYDPTDDLRVLEAMWLDKLQPFGDAGYNSRPAQR